MNPFIIISDFESNALEEYSKKEHLNINQRFCQFLKQLIMEDSQRKNGKNNPGSYNPQDYLTIFIKQQQSETNNESGILITIDKLVTFFIEECAQNFLPINPCFANYYLHLLIRDTQDGLELNDICHPLSVCKIENFLEKALTKYKNPLEATVCNMKISYFSRNSRELSLDFVKEKYELEFDEKLKQLIKSILQYPESSSDKQLEEMFIKMQVFIITNYQLGCPKNHVILKQCRQSLNSVLGKGDIQKYVLRKKYHRLEYLQKLGATVAGILIFNNQGPQGDKENMRNIFADLKMAQCNTKDSLAESMERALFFKQSGSNVMQELIAVNVHLKVIFCLRPLIQIREINKFVVLFEVYRKNLEKAKKSFEKTLYLIEVAEKKFNCVVEKINEILKFRSAIESELIFPHFVYLSEIWQSLVLYLNHLVEINKIKDHFDNLLNENLENNFQQLLEELSDKSKHLKQPLKYTFEELMKSNIKRESKLNMLNIKPFVKDYCGLTLALTGGLLVPSQLEKKLCENVDLLFGFANMEYAKFAERYFKDFIKKFRNTILTSTDLILLFELDEEVMQQDFDLIQQTKTKTNSLETQTENILLDEHLTSRQVNRSWNVWDFHRQTINLANIRKKQTHNTQTKLCYGLRNAQNQTDRKTSNSTHNSRI
ncbi:cilia- and flagella-associated protein 206 [Lucilia sericata]|uniref:cilia- and flagella-associated protein 206 n=1 Tax=Lucilia sericata TaxID=13632 RepID=UPI0018A82A37|nr:cilia- and flagella-associated protein 206 [Lucilia sericata]